MTVIKYSRQDILREHRLLRPPRQALAGHVRLQGDLQGDLRFSFSMTQLSSGTHPPYIAPEDSQPQRSPRHHGFEQETSTSFACDSPSLLVPLLQVLFPTMQSLPCKQLHWRRDDFD